VNGRALTLAALVFGLFFAAVATRRPEVAWLAAPLLTLLAAGALRAPDPEAIRLVAQRRVERSADGSVRVRVAVSNQGAAPLHVRLLDGPRPAVRVTEGARRLCTVLSPAEEVVLEYGFRVLRGRFVWSAVQAVVTDPLGLAEAAAELPSPAEFHVHPELVRFRPLPLQPRRTLPAPGSVAARVGGGGTEFFGVREYQVGDSLRWLDWRLTARHPGRLFTREFEQEQIADVGLVLDARVGAEQGPGEEGHAPATESLFEHAVRATASLAEIFLRQGHRVSLLVLGETEVRVFPAFGRIQLKRILSCLAGVHPHGEAGGGHARSLARMFPARSLLLVLSPLAFDDAPLFHRLKGHGRQVVVVCPDAIDFHAGAVGRDPVGQLALRAARVERQLGLRAVAQLRIPVVDWQVSQPLYPLIRTALRPARGQRPV